ncbi:MAG: hypothetical protein LBS31_04660 [Candidatus Adiutrix sp.]|jgi:hypothetical protein|nr:hypothetical protein [Candidatus Adiutrix sp.]
MPDEKRAAALSLARDLCLKMIERRSIAPEQLPGALSLLTVAAENVFAQTRDGAGLWVVRLARDFTLKAIERNQVAGPTAAAAYLAEFAFMIYGTAQKLHGADLQGPLSAAKDLVLKLLETGRISSGAVPALFEELALAASEGRN